MDTNTLLPFLPIDRRHALHQGAVLPDRTRGAALFADISGFTPLTAALAAELGRQRGAEVVLDYLNPIYEALITELYTYHGSVISFAGDSITCWIEEETETAEDLSDSLKPSSLAAVTCAFAMQDIMARMGRVTTPGGEEITLSIKIAVAAGPARRFLVGHPQHQLFEALAGATLERMAAAEHQAEKGEVVVSVEVAEILGNAVTIAEWRNEEGTRRPFARVTEVLHSAPRHPWPNLPAGALAVEQLRPWLAAPVYERLLSGATYLAELRPATSLFLKFGGIDYDGDNTAGSKLDAFIRWVQGILDRYSGTMRQLTIGDKGSNLLAVFGAPVAHDDDNARAIAAALELRTPPEELVFITPPQIGVSQGLVWAGACGGRLRCIYTVMGDEVNMAARLMGKAAPGQVLVNQSVADDTARSYEYATLGPIQLKGRAEPLPVSAVTGRRQARLSALFNTPLVGRENFLGVMHDLLHAPGQVLRLEGPAGVGKSHLAAVFAEQVAASGWQVATGICQSTTQGAAYVPWRQLFATLLDTGDGANVDAEAQATQVAKRLMGINPAWEARLPLLSDLLDLPLPDNDMTAALDPKLRQRALFALVTEILQAWARRQPLLLMLEDVHWMDEASAALTVVVARALYRSPAALVLVQRPPLGEQRILPELEALATHHHLALDDLSPEGVATLVRNRLGGDVGQLALDLLFAQAQGNPFFTEELVDTLREVGYLVHDASKDKWRLSEVAFEALLDAQCVAKVEGHWQMVENPPLSAVALDIPDSVHGTVLARMDRLPEVHKLTLKVASVIGRTFQLAALQSVHPSSPPFEALREQIEAMGQRDFVRLETALEEDPVFIFKHNTTQEVAYDTLLYAQRQQLHARVGAWYEQTYGNEHALAALTLDSPLAAHYPVLAYHWRNAGQPERECVYAGLAGEQAAKQYANEGALRYFSRALELTPEGEWERRFGLLLQREAAHNALSRREAQAQDLVTLDELATLMQDTRKVSLVHLRQANYGLHINDFPLAITRIQEAAQGAETTGDEAAQAAIYQSWGRILWYQGDYPTATQKLEHAMGLARKSGNRLQEARCLYDTGSIHYFQNDFPQALACYQQANSLFGALSHRTGEMDCLLMFGGIHYAQGDYDRAQADFEQALAIARAIGWRHNEASLLSNLGGVFFELGDYSRVRIVIEEALIICREIGDQWGEASCLDTLSLTHHILGDDVTAHDYSKQALQIQRAIQNRRSQGYALNHLGMVQESMENYLEARSTYAEALALRRELGQEALSMDDLAGLARVALTQKQFETAQSTIEEILAWLAEHAPDGIEFPVLVYLSCYQALVATGQHQRAMAVLENGYKLLMERANHIQDESIRQQFLERVPFNRAFLEAWRTQRY